MKTIFGFVLFVAMTVVFFVTKESTAKRVKAETEQRVRAETIKDFWGQPIKEIKRAGMPDNLLYEVVAKEYPLVILKTIEEKPRIYLVFDGIISGTISPGDELKISGNKLEKN